MQAKNIDEVLGYLEGIIQQTITDGNPMGYFAAMYHRVTLTIKDGVGCGYYLDCKRMEALDVVFANRYLEAYTRFQQNETCTDSWLYAFQTTKKYWPTVLQNLLLGMNAHISLDLGIAAVQTCPGEGIHSLKEDFNKINVVLSGLVADVEKGLGEIWPTLKFLLARFGKIDSFLIDFSMREARDGAWKFATELAAMNSLQQEAAIKDRDKKITQIAGLVSKPGFFISTIFLVVRLGEIGSVAKKIERFWKKKATLIVT